MQRASEVSARKALTIDPFWGMSIFPDFQCSCLASRRGPLSVAILAQAVWSRTFARDVHRRNGERNSAGTAVPLCVDTKTEVFILTWG